MFDISNLNFDVLITTSMKKKLFYFGIAALTLGFVACNQNANNAENAEQADSTKVMAEQPAAAPAPAFDKVGAYAGTLPCADCGGLETTVELMGDMTYKVTQDAKGKKDGGHSEAAGSFTFDASTGIITLEGADALSFRKLLVEGDNVVVVGDDGAKAAENADKYVLTKK